MKEHGLTVDDLGQSIRNETRSAEPKTESTASAKYRDPKSGAEWSGRGRAPGWIANAKNRNRFLIDGNAASATVTTKKASAAGGNYVRGPQPAKYRDPKSGATWSGRGKAPAWLANARDRTRFLIDAAQAGSDEKSSSDKAATGGARKNATVKAASKKASKKASASVNKPVSKKAASKKAASKKAASKKAASKKAAPAAAKNNAGASGADTSALAASNQAV
jgi:DNA-binding protein H-NS